MPPKGKQEEEDPEVEKTEGDEEESEKDLSETQDEEQEQEEELSLEEAKKRLAQREARLREVNKEAKERRLALEALQKEKKERDEAELSEKEKAEKRAKEAEDNLAALQKENRSLKLSSELASTAKELKLEFASEQARKDALSFLDPEKIGEDFENLEDEIKELSKTRPYLFAKPDPEKLLNDGSKKGSGRGAGKAPTNQAIINKKRQISPL